MREFPGGGSYVKKGLDENERHSCWEEGVLFTCVWGGTGPPNPSPVNPVYVGIKPKIPRDPI